MKTFNKQKIFLITILAFAFAFTATATYAALTFSDDAITSTGDLILAPTGNVGIGTYTPAQSLTVGDESSLTSLLQGYAGPAKKMLVAGNFSGDGSALGVEAQGSGSSAVGVFSVALSTLPSAGYVQGVEAEAHAGADSQHLEGVAGFVDANSFDIESAYALHAWDGSVDGDLGNGSITNLYGLYIDDQTLGTNNYAIKTGLGKVQFGDSPGSYAVWDASDFGWYVDITGDTSGYGVYGIRRSASDWTITGVEGDVYFTGSVAVSNNVSAGVTSYANADGAGVTVAQLASMRALLVEPSNGAVITNSYGLLIDDQTGATNNYAIKTGLGKVEFGDVVQFDAANGAQPTCDSSHRFQLWTVAGGAGVKDKVEICAKDAGNAYAWRVIY